MRYKASCLGAFGLMAALAVPAQGATEKERRRLKHQIGQALLYVKMKIPERAIETLEKMTATEPGASDGLVWLALARTHYSKKDLDQAGLAFGRAENFGVADRLDEEKWAKTFHKEFKENIGSVQIRGAECETKAVQFPAKLGAPMVDPNKRGLLEAMSGWRAKRFNRSIERPFYLPTGKYKFGDARVELKPGAVLTVTATEIGAECTLPEGVVKQGDILVKEVKTESFVEKNWLWLALGGVAVVGGGVAAAVAAGSGGPKTFELNPQPGTN